MRELSVQAASDATMGQEDKEAIQKEISSLKDEVDRISKDTEYNTKTLLDGSLEHQSVHKACQPHPGDGSGESRKLRD